MIRAKHFLRTTLLSTFAVLVSLPALAAAQTAPTGLLPFAATATQTGSTAADPARQYLKIAQAERRKRRSRSRSRKSSSGGAAASAGGLAGRYGILREDNKDVGCLLNLNRNGRAQLGPGCADHGFVIFDPVGWQGSGGRITLRARKGHRINFSRKPDGTWQRDPAGKKPLGLKKY